MRRQTPVAYLEHGDGWLISGGAGGQAPVDWVANLRADTDAVIDIGGGSIDVVAEMLQGNDYDDARAAAIARWPRVTTYERRAGRTVPLFVLRRRSQTPDPRH